jgi:Ca-activated chloride channel family protein
MVRAGLIAVMALATACGPKKPADVPPDPIAVVSDPEIVQLHGALAQRYVAAAQDGEVIARLRIDTRPFAHGTRPPLNLALAIDTSGSMEGDAIVHARDAALSMVDKLRDGDRLAVVVFHSHTDLLVESTVIDADTRPMIKARIETMQAAGTTDLAGGLQQALQQTYSHVIAEGVNRVVLLSDGVPNDENQILALADQSRGYNVSVTALGLGLDYNESLLGAIAQRSGGSFHYIESADAVAKVFDDEVLRLQRVVARQLMVTLTPGPGITINNAIGYPTSVSGRNVYVQLGDLSEGEERDIYVRLGVRGHRGGATVELIDAALSFQDAAVGAGALTRNLFLSVRSTDEEAQLLEGRDEQLEKDALRAELAAVVVQAIATARSGQLPQAQAILNDAVPRARAAADRYNDPSFGEQADEMDKVNRDLPAVAPAPPPVQPGSPQPSADAPSAPSPQAAGNVRRAHSTAVETFQNRPSSR